VLNDVMESYTINPANDFKFSPSLNISNCNFTSTSIKRVQRFKIICTIQMRDPITLIFSDFSVINNCEVPNGMMTMGNYYRVLFVAYDPYGEYIQNVTKYSSINLVSSPVSSMVLTFV